jgi:DNA-binding LytR/AlgR family response regulator
MPTAIIADDEPLLQRELQEMLADLWPEIDVIGTYPDGAMSLRAIQDDRPDIAFLDIRMPKLSGLEVAERIQGDCLVVFVTAYDEHAVAAFEQGAADYLLKPLKAARLADTVARLRQRLDQTTHGTGRSAHRLERIQATVGNTLRFLAVAEIYYCRADSKYTRVVTADSDALIRRSVSALCASFDPGRFWQINRGIVVNVDFIDRIVRDECGQMTVHLRDGRAELPVSKAHQGQFKGM